jgi:hypothetical protein
MRYVALLMALFALTGCTVLFIPVPIDLPNVASTVVDYTKGVTVETAKDYLPELGDMPIGWSMSADGQAGTNEDISAKLKDPVAAKQRLDELGRLGGYFRSFDAPNGCPSYGNCRLDFSLIIFATPEGAKNSFSFYEDRDREFYDTLSEVSGPDLGDSNLAYRVKWVDLGEDKATPQAWEQYEVLIQKGNVLLSMGTLARPGATDIDQLADMAAKAFARLP